MAKISAYQTQLRIGDGATPTEGFTTIAHVTSISGPSLGVDTADVTGHDSASAWEESIATVVRSGEVTFEIVYDPDHSTHNITAGLAGRVDDRTTTNFRLIFPNTTTWTFPALVTGFEPDTPHDGAMTASVTLKITGAPTLV